MNVLVTGGAASGKSAYAEQVTCRLSATRTYAATMSPIGAEAQERIERHRQQRADWGFFTVECANGLAAAVPEIQGPAGVVLVEDLGNLVANALFGKAGTVSDAAQVLDALEAELATVMGSYEHAVVVGNEVGAAGEGASGAPDAIGTYVRVLGSLACRVAARCDTVVEVVAGIPCVVKGGLL